MNWTVETANAIVDDEIAALPKDIRAALLRLSERIEAVGLTQIGKPHVKHLRGKFWEMRLTGRDGIGRAIYITILGKRVIILHAFIKKTEKLPASALVLAERRAKEINT